METKESSKLTIKSSTTAKVNYFSKLFLVKKTCQCMYELDENEFSLALIEKGFMKLYG